MLYGDSPTPAQMQEYVRFVDRIKSAHKSAGVNLTSEDKAKLLRMKNAGTRYISFNAGTGGANPQFHLLISDDGSIDGRGYLLKPIDGSFREGANHAELVGALLAGRMGFASGPGRHIPAPVGGQIRDKILIELAPNFADGHVINIGASRNRANDILDAESRLGAALINGLMGAGDRHSGNGMVFVGNGAMPIDFGRAFYKNIESPSELVRYLFSSEDYGHIDSNPMRGYRARYDTLITEVGMSPSDAANEIYASLAATIGNWARSIETALDDGSVAEIDDLYRGKATGPASAVAGRTAVLRRRLEYMQNPAFIDGLISRMQRRA
jgi:hypothetical protein